VSDISKGSGMTKGLQTGKPIVWGTNALWHIISRVKRSTELFEIYGRIHIPIRRSSRFVSWGVTFDKLYRPYRIPRPLMSSTRAIRNKTIILRCEKCHAPKHVFQCFSVFRSSSSKAIAVMAKCLADECLNTVLKSRAYYNYS